MNKTEPKTAVKTGRVQWIDFAKGIAILATILGHTADVGKTGSDVRALIFSFHMPLFFILSILTIEFSSQRNQAERENLLLNTAAAQAQKEIAQLSLADKKIFHLPTRPAPPPSFPSGMYPGKPAGAGNAVYERDLR